MAYGRRKLSTQSVRLYAGTTFHDFRIASRRADSRSLTVLCVFHQEKSPSLSLWRASGRFHCHGCCVGGTFRELAVHLGLIESGDEDSPVELWDMSSGPGQQALPLRLVEAPPTSAGTGVLRQFWADNTGLHPGRWPEGDEVPF